jgi:hypothetical protein
MSSDRFREAARLLARYIAEEIRTQLANREPDTDRLVDRETAGVSKRWWDREHGRSFPCIRDGRRIVAKRSDVMAALERSRRFAPAAVAAGEPRDADEAALARAGIRLASGGR